MTRTSRLPTLVAIDLRRLRRGVAVSLPAFAGALVLYARAAPALRATGLAGGTALGGYAAIAEATERALALGALMTAILTSHLVASDRSSGVLAALLVTPVPRRAWVASRVAAAVIRAALLVAALAAAAWIAGAILFDLGPVRDGKIVLASAAEARGAVLLGTMLAFPPLLAVALVATAIGMSAPGPASAVGTSVMLVLVAAFFGSAEPRLGPWLFTSYMPVIGGQSALATAARIAQGFADADWEVPILVRSVTVSAATGALAALTCAVAARREKLAWRDM